MSRIWIIGLVAGLAILGILFSYTQVMDSGSLLPATSLFNSNSSPTHHSELKTLAPARQLHLKLKPAGFSNSIQCLRFSRNFAQLHGFSLHLPATISTPNHHDKSLFSFEEIFLSELPPVPTEQCQDPVTIDITGNGNALLREHTETPCLIIECSWIWTDCFLPSPVYDAYLPKFAEKAERIVEAMQSAVATEDQKTRAPPFTFLSAHIRLGDRAKHSQPLLPFPCEDAGLLTPSSHDSLATCWTGEEKEALNFSRALQVLHSKAPTVQALFLSSDRPTDARKLVGSLPGVQVVTIADFASELENAAPESVLTMLVEQEIWIRSAGHLSTWPSSITERTLLMKQAREPDNEAMLPFQQAVLRLHKHYKPPTLCPLLQQDEN